MGSSGSWSPKEFPNLNQQNHEITSEGARSYNCFAWAAGETKVRWDPDIMGQYYWPPGVERGETREAVVAAYQTLGYEECVDASLEVGFEKIAIYEHADGTATHATRQLTNGKWTSKLGDFEDIEHDTLDCLDGPLYGRAIIYLKRKSTLT